MPIDKALLPDWKTVEAELTTHDIEVIKEYASIIEPPACYVEIGTMHGGGALRAASFVKDGVDVYSVDPNHVNLMKAKDSLDKSGIKFIKGCSVDIAKTWTLSIGTLFIDGDHRQAKQDFEAWKDYVVPGGHILFHDYAIHSPEVIKDCIDLLFMRPKYEALMAPQLSPRIASSIFVVRKN